MRRPLFALACLCAAIPVAPLAAQEDRPRTVLVLDASGSMWGQIDGTAKITIAQEVVGDLLDTLPETEALGLTAYGHRTRGDCSDIEVLVPPAPDTRDAIRAAVGGLSPKGKTPMTDAVRQAAEALRYGEDRATVILVSDGIETCEPDPCAAARALEETGVDFTVHVVGFDVAGDPEALAQMQCLAEETGGRFLTAANAGELAGALTEVAAAPEAVTVPVRFRATEGDAGPEIDTPLIWDVTGAQGTAVEARRGAGFTQDLPPGDYTAVALRPDDEASGETDFSIAAGDEATVTVVLPAPLPEATLEGPESATAGSTIPVNWVGPDGRGDYVAVAEAGADGYVNYTYTRDGSPLDLLMPPEPGAYELRYVASNGGDVLATQAIAVTPVAATLDAAEAGPAGAALPVDWTGPDYRNDYVAVADPGADGYINYTYTREGSPAEVLLPSVPGRYELRYVMSQDRTVLATRPVEVGPVEATLDAPEGAATGATVPVGWTGPDYRNDYIAVAEPGEDGYINYTYTRDGSPLDLLMPSEPGDYELRYVMAQDQTVLATRPITLSEVDATLDAAAEAVAGDALEVAWQGPDYRNDYIAIAKVGEDGYETYTYTREGSPLRVQVPLATGAYELRYVMAQDGRVLAAQPLGVVDVGAALEAVETARAGAPVAVDWQGPGYDADYIAVARPGEDGYVGYTYTREGSPLIVTMPPDPGTYELRYVAAGDGQRVLARRDIVAEEVTATISATARTTSGEPVAVDWEGPDYRRDFIAISGAGAPDNEYGEYVYTTEDSPVVLRAPERPGDYEIRYHLGDGNRVIGRAPLTVAPPE